MKFIKVGVVIVMILLSGCGKDSVNTASTEEENSSLSKDTMAGDLLQIDTKKREMTLNISDWVNRDNTNTEVEDIMHTQTITYDEGTIFQDEQGSDVRPEEVTIYKLGGISEKPVIVVTDSKEINDIEEAVHEAEKIPGIVNVANPQYRVEIGEKTYFLWMQEGSEALMDVTDTHTIYTFSDQSVKKVNKLLASQFGEIASRHYILINFYFKAAV